MRKHAWSSNSFLLLGLLIPLTLCLIYLPGLQGGFVFDDEANIVNISIDNEQPTLTTLQQITFGNDSGPFGRPVAMFTFALQIITTGLNPFPMKLVNLGIHWALGIVLFFLSQCLLSKLTNLSTEVRSWTSLVIVTVWLFHPFNLTSVAYIIQRMNSLSALFVALAAFFYTKERIRQQANPSVWTLNLILIIFCGSLAVFSKENALLLPVYLFVIEYCLFGFRAAKQRDTFIVKLLFIVTLLIPILFALTQLVLEPSSIIGSYQHRHFTLIERLLTECRVLVWYLVMLLLPNINQMTLYHDGIILSTSLLSPLTTLLSAIVLGLLLSSALLLRRVYPWYSFGILWFFGGHLLESTVFPLELVYEHRNYLPGFGIIFSTVVGVAIFFNRFKLPIRLKVAIALVIFVLLAVNTHTLAYRWSGSYEAMLLDAEHHPESPRANIFAGTTYGILAKRAQDKNQKEHFFSRAEHHFQQSYKLTPNSANALFGWLFLYYDNHLNPPKRLLVDLEQKLKNGLIEATTVNGLHKLTQCQIKNYCKLSNAQYLSMMDAAFSNPNITKPYATAILRDLAVFHTKNNNDYKMAILLTKKALEMGPSPGIRLDLVHYFANAGFLQNALDELDIIEQEDNMGIYATDIREWRELITRISDQSLKQP